MLKFAVVMAALLAAASVAMAGLTFQINADTSGSNLIQDLAGGPVVATPSGYNTSFVRGYHYYDADGNDQVADIFRVVVTLPDVGTGTRYIHYIQAVGMGLLVSGDGASHLTALPAAMRVTAGQLRLELTAQGFVYPFTTTTAYINAAYENGKQTHIWVGDDRRTVTAGNAVGEFIYIWDGYMGNSSVTLHLASDSVAVCPEYYDGPVLYGQQAGWRTGTVSNNDLVVPLPVPEPATLSLLGLGLAGLFSRRRK